ncbi:MAG: bifunctional precorrin-2 dehydrogenase/sirohydrochlorin ferrochelatase [Saprospiraceae bacterium]|jgi:siroheme synthase-like protein|nr:bifunctional precorrin-2 dehydrogenase/sirohydrochlorin ferrochelatase [Saprospiraceae bacterium]
MKERNTLYPIFLKLHQLPTLIVGAGEVGHEKLSFMLKSSPKAQVTLVAPWIAPKIQKLLEMYPDHKVKIRQKPFEEADLEGFLLVVAATNMTELNHEVYRLAKAKEKIINVADTPALCDFYLGSIVTRGNLKVAISTNGKSPTFAKRFRQLLEQILPAETDDLLTQLKIIRDQLKGDFEEKVKALNEVTKSLVKVKKTSSKSSLLN